MAESTVTKSRIFVEDLNFATGGTGAVETGVRRTSVGGEVTLTKIDASHIKYRNVSMSIENSATSAYLCLTEAEIIAAITAIGSDIGLIKLINAISLTDDLTIPTNIRLDQEPDAILSIPTTKTLTINGTLEDSLNQKFSCTGTGAVVFGTGSVKEIYPEWWGATPDGTTNNYAYIQAAIIAATPGTLLSGAYPSIPVVLSGGVYAVQSCINGTNKTGLIIKGAGGGLVRGTTILGSTGAGKAILDVSGSAGAHIEGVTLLKDTSTIGLLTSKTTVDACNNQVFRDVFIYLASSPTANDNLGTVGVICKSAENITFDHINVYADIPVIISNTDDLSFIASPGANTHTVTSEYATLSTLSQGVVTFTGDCSLVGYRTRPILATFDANTVNLGSTYMGISGAATSCYTALYIRNCDTLTWHGHAEGFNTLMEIPGYLSNAHVNVKVTPATTLNPVLNLNPYNPGVAGGGMTNTRITIELPGAAAVGCFAASTDASHPSYLDNIILTANQWAVGDIATIRPDAQLLPMCRNVRVQLLGGAHDYFGTGLWTPVIAGSTGAGTATYTVQFGKYVRIGNVIHATGNLTWSGHTGTGNITITGLPYAIENVANIVPVGSIQSSTLVYAKNALFLLSWTNESTLYLYEKDPLDVAQQAVAMAAAGGFTFSITYYTN